MKPPQAIRDLVEHFQRNADDFRSNRYNEADLRREFLDPFFEALGWDVNNHLRYSEWYKDVVHEPTRETEQGTPDYCFRVGGSPKFFVEAKKPSVRLKDNPDPALQLRRYAWSSKLSLSVLSNFDELAIYDCRIAPMQGDKASTGRISYYTFDEYPLKWEEIASRFSKEAVLQGSFDRFAISSKAKRGTAEVDAAFLADIEDWRHDLAAGIAIKNSTLGPREVNFAVQRTIDRIIFLRICEDRGLESYGQLRALTELPGIYSRLCNLFQLADKRYNSGLFHFHQEKDRNEIPDTLTPTIIVEDARLKPILKKLYYPESPYAFSHVPADILGQVYEQFLGKVIRITPARQVKVEAKPEVQKAGGVYYTPTYIVDYIVKSTVGKLLEGKSPKQVTKIRILDPACGSGSFLIGAYQYLLNWYRDRYMEEGAQKHKNEIVSDAVGNWRLTLSEKKKILTRHIFGVDIDSQAVEVTKLSLLLKVLEAETQLKLFHERALPDLGSNIKCGNSLIGPDFYENQQLLLLDDEDRYRINIFDWKQGFPEAMKSGGFDAVIGNPPYIRIQTLKTWSPNEVDFFNRSYSASGSGSYDIYVIFIERGLSLLNPGGCLGFILPSKFFVTDYGQPIRKLITSGSCLGSVVDFRHEQIFKGPTTYTCLLFLSGQSCEEFTYAEAVPAKSLNEGLSFRTVPADSLSELPWSFESEKQQSLAAKLSAQSVTLLELPSDIARGSSTGDDAVFVLSTKGKKLFTLSGEETEIEPELLRIPLYATDFGRYRFDPNPTGRIIFPYRVNNSSYSLIPEEELRHAFPMAYKYLASNRRALQARKQTSHWYGYSAPRSLNVHDSAQLVVPLLAEKGMYAELPKNMKRYCLMAGGGFSISVNQKDCSAHYLLGLLNSTLLFWRLKSISNLFRGGWITCTKQYVGTLPILVPDSSSKKQVVFHDRIAQLAGEMMKMVGQVQSARTDQERTVLQRQIEATDRQIDKLVYELYGLTEEEIAIVESSVKG